MGRNTLLPRKTRKDTKKGKYSLTMKDMKNMKIIHSQCMYADAAAYIR